MDYGQKKIGNIDEIVRSQPWNLENSSTLDIDYVKGIPFIILYFCGTKYRAFASKIWWCLNTFI